MKHCLVVDDSRVIRTVARKILESLDFDIKEAEDGLAGLRACREKMPDLIILDSNLPAMTGIEFLQSVRRQADGARPAILLCTTENDADQIADALAAGADEYFLKPFDAETVRARLAAIGIAPAS